MKASERARRYREEDRPTALQQWMVADLAVVAGGSGLAYLSIGLLSASWEQWWALAAAVAVGLVVAFAIHRSAR